MILELKMVSTLAPILLTEATLLSPNHPYFCVSCNRHREEFKPEDCLLIYQHNALGKPSFVGFVCPNCFSLGADTTFNEVTEEATRLDQLKEEIKVCSECGLLPAVNAETELCQECINDFEEWRATCMAEKLAPYTPALV